MGELALLIFDDNHAYDAHSGQNAIVITKDAVGDVYADMYKNANGALFGVLSGCILRVIAGSVGSVCGPLGGSLVGMAQSAYHTDPAHTLLKCGLTAEDIAALEVAMPPGSSALLTLDEPVDGFNATAYRYTVVDTLPG